MAISSGSFLVDFFGVIVAIGVILYAYIKWSYQYWTRKGVPYLKPTIPFGNINLLFWQTASLGIQVKELYNQAKAKGCKYCGIYNMTSPNLMILDKDLVKNILIKDFAYFTDRGEYYNEKDDPLSAHLFAIGGPKWRRLRTKMTPTFTSGKMKLMFHTLAGTGEILEKFLDQHVGDKEPLDIKDVLARFTIDIIGTCAFGIKCNSFEEPNSPFKLYGQRAFVPTKLESIKQMFCFAFPEIGRALGLTMFPKDLSRFFIKMTEDVVTYREKNNVIRQDFMQLLIELKNKNEEQAGFGDSKALTMEELAAQCFVFFIGGFETSATTMTFALYELASHPEIQKKVREEIKTVLAKHNNQMTYDALGELHYMKQVIDETLRKYPPLSFLTRMCGKDYKVPGEDLVIEKDTIVMISIEGIHYDKEYYENPEKFDPERFTEENKKTRHPCAHIPFGEGPRVCIGERFGILQTKVGLTSALKNHTVKLHERTQVPLKMSVDSFFPSPEGGIWLTFQKA